MAVLFDKPATCQKVWNRLLSGFVLDSLESDQPERPVEASDVERLLENLETFNWEQTQAVGEGEEYRAESATGDHASALAFGNVVLHGSVVCQ